MDSDNLVTRHPDEDPRKTIRPPLFPDDSEDPPEDRETASAPELAGVLLAIQQEAGRNDCVELFRRVFASPSCGHGLQQEERARVLAAGWRACGLDRTAAPLSLDDCIPVSSDSLLPSRQDLETAFGLLEAASGRIPAEVFEPGLAYIRTISRKSSGVDPGLIVPRPQEGNWATPFIPPEVVALSGLMAPAAPSVVEVSASDSTAHRTVLTAADLRARANDIVEWFRVVLRSDGPPPLQYLGIAVGWDVPVGEESWIIGDLHGDLLALECALEIVDRLSESRQPKIVFLGDLFDDGGFGVETILKVLELGSSRPGCVTWIAGNHDDAFGFDPGAQSYYSTVIPCDFADQVNQSPEGSADRAAATVAAWLATRLPRALLFEDGLLATHGGFPLPDLWPSLQSPKDLARPEALRDFTWARAHDRIRNKLPTRVARTSDFGRDDLAMFANIMSRLLDGRPVHRLIRGHDHIVDRFNLHPTYQRVPMRTINALSRRLPREVYGGYTRAPVVARHRPGETPVIYRIHVPDDAIFSAYPFGNDVETRGA